jgi:predicted regulator of Ras-like GTPase activity (Roadblock/LC7/MglB family)
MLSDLVDRAPGVRGGIFCDFEGEFIELVLRDPRLSEFDLKIVGAQVCAAWANLRSQSATAGAGEPQEMKIGCAQGTILCRGLPEGYYLLLLLEQGKPVGAIAYAMAQAATSFARELL